MTVSDPEWDDDDRDAAFLWSQEDAAKCAGCGHPFDESSDAGDAAAWIAEEVVCFACAAMERAARKERQDGSKSGPPGVKYRTRNRRLDPTGGVDG